MAQRLAGADKAKEGKEAAKNLSEVLDSAAKIADAVVKSKDKMEALAPGWNIFSLFGIKRDTFGEGAAVLRVMTPRVVLLAKAIINMAKEQTAGNIVKEGQDAAKNLANVLESAAKITKSVVDSKKQLEDVGDRSFLGWAWSFFKGDPLKKGAETLQVMTPQTVLLAKAIIEMANRMAPDSAVKEGKDAARNLGDILTSAGKITKAVVDSKKQLEDIGSKSFLGWAWSFFRRDPLEEGAETLQVMTPQTVLLAKAIINMAKRMSGGMAGAKDGKQAARDLGDVLTSAGKIAKAVVDSKKTLDGLNAMNSYRRWMVSILGRSEDTITDTAKGIITGIVVPIMTALPPQREVGSARDKLRGVLDVLDQLPQFLNDLSQRMIALGNAKYLNYDLDSKTKEFSDWFYTIGTSIANGILHPIVDGFPPAKAIQEAGESLNETRNLMAKVELFINDLATRMINFSESWWWQYQEEIWRSTAIFSYFFHGIAWALGKGVAEPIIKYFPKAEVLQDAGERVKEMGELVKKVTKLVDTLSKNLVPFVDGWWWYSPVARIGRDTQTFAYFFTGIAQALWWGMAFPVLWYFPKAEVLKEAGERVLEMGELVKKVTALVDTLSKNLVPFVDGWWWYSPVAKIGRETATFAFFFNGIAAALSWGVANPIIRHFPKADVLKAAAESTEQMGNLVMQVTRVIGILSKNLVPFTNGWWWNSPISKLGGQTKQFESFFDGIGDALDIGMLDPIMESFPDASEVQEATATLTVLIEALDGLLDVMDELTSLMDEFSSISVDFSKLDSIGGVFKSGELEFTIKAATDDEGPLGQSDDTQTWMDKMLGVFTGIRSPGISGHGKFLKGFSRGVGGAVEKPMGDTTKATKKVGSGVTRLGGTMSRFTNTTGDLPRAINQMKDMLHTDLVNILTQLRNAPGGGGGGGGGDPLNRLVTNTNNINTTLGNINTSLTNIAGGLNNINNAMTAANTTLTAVGTTLNNIGTALTTTNATLNQMKASLVRISAATIKQAFGAEALQELEREATSGTSLDTHDHTAEELLERMANRMDRMADPRRQRPAQAPPGSAPGGPQAQAALQQRLQQQQAIIQRSYEQQLQALQALHQQQTAALQQFQQLQAQQARAAGVDQRIVQAQQQAQTQMLQQQQQFQQRALQLQAQAADRQQQALQQQAQTHGAAMVQANDRPLQQMQQNVERRTQQATRLLNKQQDAAIKNVNARFRLFDNAAKKERDQVLRQVEQRRRALGQRMTEEQRQYLALIEQQARQRYDIRMEAATQERDAMIDNIRQQTGAMSDAVRTQSQQMQQQIQRQMIVPPAGPQRGDFPQRTPQGEALAQASDALQSLEHEATSGTSIDTHDHTLQDLMVNKVLPHVEKLVAVAVAQEERAKTTTNNAEFDKQVQSRVEQARPSEAMMSSLEYLAAIAANTAATHEAVQDAVEVLEDIRDQLTAPAGGSSDDGPNTKPNKKPKQTPNYFSWQFGRFGDTASKQYNNPGT
jgi:hypothetical protein